MISRIEPGTRMSAAVRHGNVLYLAGQVARDDTADIGAQTRDVLDQIDAVLAKAGSDKSALLSVQVLLADIGDFAAMNVVYDSWVDTANPPARACFEARLAKPGWKIEIVAVAAIV